MKCFVLDEREIWHRAVCEAARNHGLEAQRIFRGEQVTGCSGIGFIRPHAEPAALRRNHSDFAIMSDRLLMIQDAAQMALYEDKSGQFARWADWMPATWRFTNLNEALTFVTQDAPYPLVSKADVGASSVNVRILPNRDEAARHIRAIFGAGLRVQHCAGRSESVQRGYALLQRFVPHDVTWRVNAIGRARAIFRRFNYPDRQVAQTGNVEPVTALNDETESLLEFSDRFFNHAETQWCAIDVLKEGSEWRLLETSLAWPWPSPGTCNSAPIFRSKHQWLGMFEAMFDELQACSFGYANRFSPSMSLQT